MAYKGMGQIDKKELWTIPNIITYFRILCIPAYIVLMAFAGLRADAVLLYVALGSAQRGVLLALLAHAAVALGVVCLVARDGPECLLRLGSRLRIRLTSGAVLGR